MSRSHPRRRLRLLTTLLAGLVAVAASLTACGSGSKTTAAQSGTASNGNATSTTITLYTSITQATVDAVVDGFRSEHPNVKVSVFRAATGALNARIATDRRTGGIKADVLWVSDPLTMHGYENLLEEHLTPAAGALPAEYRTPAFAGAGLLYLVLVYRKGLTPAPTSWVDLASPAYRNEVAIPDPGFAGSAMGALGYFGEQKSFGLDFYRRLKANGATQLKSPEDVITAVAQGRAKVGMTIADSALADIKKGSPIAVAWPAPGAIAIYSPIGVVAKTRHKDAAEAFEDFALSSAGQTAIAKTGRQPSLPGINGIDKPADAKVVSPNWPAFFADKDTLLAEYQKIFGS